MHQASSDGQVNTIRMVSASTAVPNPPPHHQRVNPEPAPAPTHGSSPLPRPHRSLPLQHHHRIDVAPVHPPFHEPLNIPQSHSTSGARPSTNMPPQPTTRSVSLSAPLKASTTSLPLASMSPKATATAHTPPLPHLPPLSIDRQSTLSRHAALLNPDIATGPSTTTFHRLQSVDDVNASASANVNANANTNLPVLAPLQSPVLRHNTSPHISTLSPLRPQLDDNTIPSRPQKRSRLTSANVSPQKRNVGGALKDDIKSELTLVPSESGRGGLIPHGVGSVKSSGTPPAMSTLTTHGRLQSLSGGGVSGGGSGGASGAVLGSDSNCASGSDDRGGISVRATATATYMITTNSSSPSHGDNSMGLQSNQGNDGGERYSGGASGITSIGTASVRTVGVRNIEESHSNDWEAVVNMYTTGRGTEDGVALKMITKGDGRRVADRKLLEKRRTIGKTYEWLGRQRFEGAIGYKWENGVRRKQKMYHVISRCRAVNAMRKNGDEIPGDVNELTMLIDEHIAKKEALKEAGKSGGGSGRRVGGSGGIGMGHGSGMQTSGGHDGRLVPRGATAVGEGSHTATGDRDDHGDDGGRSRSSLGLHEDNSGVDKGASVGKGARRQSGSGQHMN